MNYEFVRMILKDVPENKLEEVFELLHKNGLEIYSKAGDSTYTHVTNASACKDGKVCVSAADWEMAEELLRAAGYEKWICSQKESVVVKNPARAAEEEFYRKRKIRQIECLVVVVLVVLYMLIFK